MLLWTGYFIFSGQQIIPNYCWPKSSDVLKKLTKGLDKNEYSVFDIQSNCKYYKRNKADASLHNTESIYDAIILVKNCGNVSVMSHEELNKTYGLNESEHSLVPNIVHYVWFGEKKQFTFLNYLSFLGANKFIKPRMILVHGDALPIGNWWDSILKEIPNVYFVHRQRPTNIMGHDIKIIQHSADIARLQLLFGNISIIQFPLIYI